MEITARLTADAKVNQLKNGREVVSFSVALNDSYKPKDSTEVKKITTFVNCSYWRNPGIAEYLTKGSLVELSGRIGINAWKNGEGEARAAITLHVNSIKLHGKGNTVAASVPEAADIKEPVEDLPF